MKPEMGLLVCALIIPLLVNGGRGKIKLSSSAFGDGKAMPSKYARQGVTGGLNLSVPLAWENIPEGTKSLALVCVDHHPIANKWIHWMVIDIPPSARSIPEGASTTDKMPKDCVELKNTFGDIGYGGPQPPKGTGPHKYKFVLYALTVDSLALEPVTSLKTFTKAVEGKVVASASWIGIFER